MPVPKERKKLDRSAGLKKPVIAKPIQQPMPVAPVTNTENRSLQQLDEAFDIMEQIPAQGDGARGAASPHSQRLGFCWMLSLEAVLPEESDDGSNDPGSKANRSPLLNLGFTIPFFWGWPIVDEMTKNYFKYFKPYRITNLF